MRYCLSFLHIEDFVILSRIKAPPIGYSISEGVMKMKMNIFDLKAEKNDGEILDFDELRGKILLIVNTATGCGFTPQYEALERLYKKYRSSGLEILDFPCDQFGHQAPGSDSEIQQFCVARYKTTFPRFKKTDVNGENASAVWKFLTDNSPEEYVKGAAHKLSMKAVEKMSTTYKRRNDIKWNFTKFLLDKSGMPVYRYSPVESPDVIEKDIARLLK